jgi:hypothetical protein
MTQLSDSVATAVEEIDAAIFSGDEFINNAKRHEMENILGRWQRGLAQMKQIAESALEESSNWEKS